MLNTNATAFRKDIYNILAQTIKYNEPVSISTKDGEAVLLSRSDYDNLMETLYLVSIPGMREKLIDGMNTPLEDCADENLVDW